MKLEYTLEKDDYVNLNLYAASVSERIQKRRRNSWILSAGIIWVFAFYLFVNDRNIVATVMFIYAMAVSLFFPKYFGMRYKKHFGRHIEENLSKRFGMNSTLEIGEESINSWDEGGESVINHNNVEYFVEIDKYFFGKTSTGEWLIVPKERLSTEQQNQLRQTLAQLGIEVKDELGWKW